MSDDVAFNREDKTSKVLVRNDLVFGILMREAVVCVGSDPSSKTSTVGSAAIRLWKRQAMVQTAMSGKQARGKFEDWLLRNIPVLLGAALFVEAGVGLVFAASDGPSISLSGASTARSTSLAQINGVTAEGHHASIVLWRVALFFFIVAALALWGMRAPGGSRREAWTKWISSHWGRVFFIAVGIQLLLSFLFSISTAIPIALGSLTIIDLFGLLLVTVIAGLRVGFFLSHLWRYFRSTEKRSDEEARGVTDTIRAVTGNRAQTLEEFFRANAGGFGSVAAAS